MKTVKDLDPRINTDYIDEIYDFKGQWDVPSKCGLKIHKRDNAHIIIASELYDYNPGTSVNYWNCQLAEQLCKERGLDPEKLVFIEHNPGKGSKIENYRETFDRVTFSRDTGIFSDPDWEVLSREDVDTLLNA